MKEPSMGLTAVLWIRDGVLVDRMHINAVAFALAAWKFSVPELRPKTTLEGLINFAFEKSGISCADKMRMFNSERENSMMDVETAAEHYNILASESAAKAMYFPGAIELLRDLQSAGIDNFITSAVEQDVLDTWSRSEQGVMIAPYLKEILGKRDNFAKGRDHFECVSRGLGYKQIYYVADAVAEIESGKQHSDDYHITPIGFGNVITVDAVLQAIKLVSHHSIQIDSAKIQLPSETEIESSLYKSGAESVIAGTHGTIMRNLRSHFKERLGLSPN
jgi:phosphoglycolate phosphatase-like HAD superfamily hydrolase